MAEMPPDADKILLRLPVWTIANLETVEKHGLSVGALGKICSPELGEFLPVFSTRELARQFVRQFIKRKEVGAVALLKHKAIRVLVVGKIKAGCKHVGLDIENVGGKPTGRFYPIGEFFQRLPPDPEQN